MEQDLDISLSSTLGVASHHHERDVIRFTADADIADEVKVDDDEVDDDDDEAMKTKAEAEVLQSARTMMQLYAAVLNVDDKDIDELTKKMDEVFYARSPEDMGFLFTEHSIRWEDKRFQMRSLPAHLAEYGENVSLTRTSVARLIFAKLLRIPSSSFTHNQVQKFLEVALSLAADLKKKYKVADAEGILEQGIIFVSMIEDEEFKLHMLYWVQKELYGVYESTHQYRKAAELDFFNSVFFVKNASSEERLRGWAEAANIWSMAGEHRKALEIITTTCAAVEDICDAVGVPFPHGDWKREAFLKFTHGKILGRATGHVEEAIKVMEEAKDLCLRFDYNYDDYNINAGFLLLLHSYGATRKFDSAISLIQLLDPAVSKTESKEGFASDWAVVKGLIWDQTADTSEAEKCWEDVWHEIGESPFYGRGTPHFKGSGALYDHYLSVWRTDRGYQEVSSPKSHFDSLLHIAKLAKKNEETALAALDGAERVVKNRYNVDDWRLRGLSDLVDVEMLRGSVLNAHNRGDEAYAAYGKAVDYVKRMDQGSDTVKSLLADCYGKLSLLTTSTRNKLGSALDLVNMGGAVLEKDSPPWYYFLLARAQFMQCRSASSPVQIGDAVASGERAALEQFKAEQFKNPRTRMAEDLWIRIIEHSMEIFRLNELLSMMDGRRWLMGLIWAERSRTRLYMRITDPSIDEKFDVDVKYAEELIRDVVLKCGEETAIIFYSYWEDMNSLKCYLICKKADQREITVHCPGIIALNKMFDRWDGPGAKPKTLRSLVNDARKDMKDKQKCSRERTKKLLSMLHSILFKSIEGEIPEGCKNLVICPEGFLSLFPFGALYDYAKEEYLIQQKTVWLTPSIRALHHSLNRQENFEKVWKTLDSPFVAGNPIPMGAKQCDLRGAALEAENVANELRPYGARLFSGEKFTKAAVVEQGLKRSQVVVLSTHCILTPPYTRGALVLRKNLDESTSSSSEETLTPDDIVASQMAIPAGIVVFSACESGLGKVTQAEGVLGLGRAVLQAGAATSVLTLWKVNDLSTKDLITGIFVSLRKGQTAAESLQASMVEMIEKPGKTIYEWASLIGMGSPNMRLPPLSSCSSGS